jgi:photosystem II stability/assembly factor-like uncharacterized protein
MKALALAVLLLIRLAPVSGASAQTRPPAQMKGIWESVGYPEDMQLTDAFFVTADEGWVTGHAPGKGGGTLLHTRDGGAHWEVQLGDPAGSQPAFDYLRFVNRSTGFVVQRTSPGDYTLLRTRDGANWEGVGTVPQHFGDYAFLSATEGVATGRQQLLRTEDGGRTWKPVFDCALKLEIRGLTRTARCDFESLHFPSSRVGYALGLSYEAGAVIVARTEDGGRSWTAWPVLPGESGHESHVFFTDEQTGYACLIGGKVVATRDGGRTWQGAPGAECPKSPVRFADPEVGWMLQGRHLTFTADGGRRWTSRELPFPATANGFSLPTRDRAYAVGDHGMIYRYRLVPADYPAAHALDAPAMPGIPSVVASQMQKLAAELKVTTTAVSAAPEGAALPPSAGLDAAQSAIATSVPPFVAQYRSTNLIIAGLRLVADVSTRLAAVQQAYTTFRHSPDRAAALTALAGMSLAVQGLGGSTDLALQQQTLPDDSGVAVGSGAPDAGAPGVATDAGAPVVVPPGPADSAPGKAAKALIRKIRPPHP